MKNRTKLLLTLMIIVVSVFTLAIVASAEEYTVTTADEFNTAYSQAVDGDTIIIKSSINSNFYFSKSITFILEGDITWTINGDTDMCNATGKDVKVYARNGNAKFYVNASYFFNSYNQTQPDLSQTTWSFGAIDRSSTITLDLSKCTGRMFYFNSNQGAMLKEFNFLYGSRVCNLNPTNTGSRYLMASTINMFEGAEFSGNKMPNYCAMVYANTFNMYGGKIYGNYFGCYGIVQAATVNIYGGEVCNNFIDATVNSNVPGSLFNSMAGSTQTPLYLYSCKIDGNVLKTNNGESQAFIKPAGSSRVVGSCYTNNNKYTSDWGTGPVMTDGVYTLDDFDMENATFSPIKGSVTICDYGMVFQKADSSVINAFIIKNGVVSKAYDGSTEIEIPTNSTVWTSKSYYCSPVTVDTTKHGNYYIPVEHTYEGVNDCTNPNACVACAFKPEAQTSHTIVET